MKDEATGTSALDNCLFEGRGHKTGAVFLGNCIGNNLARKQIENHAYVVIFVFDFKACNIADPNLVGRMCCKVLPNSILRRFQSVQPKVIAFRGGPNAV